MTIKTVNNRLVASILAGLLLAGCAYFEWSDEYHVVSYSDGMELYCIASSGSRIYIGDIVNGGECGEDFAKQGDLYPHSESGSSFLIPPQEPDCITQFAYDWNSTGPTFLFIVHSLGEDGLEILDAGESVIERRELRRDSTCLIDFWVLSAIQERDTFKIRLADGTIPVTVSPGGGGVSSLKPIGNGILIG